MTRAISRTLLFAGVLALLVTACGPTGSVAPTATPAGTVAPSATPVNFPERDITLINPFAGGNFESQARLFAPIFQAKLPKTVKVVVENVAGGAGIIGYNKAIEAPADGYTLSIDDPVGNALRKIDQGANAKFDPLAWSWLGGWFSDFPGLGVRANYAANTWQQFVEQGKTGRITFATPGKATLNHGQEQLLAKVFGLNVRYVHYQTTAEVRTALGRGEVDAYIAPASTIATWVDAKEVKWITILREGKDPQRSTVATLDDISATRDQKDQILTVSGSARGWMVNKNTPPERVKILRDAFWAAANDATWKEGLAKVGIVANPVTGEDLQKFAEGFWPTFPAKWAEYTKE
jgi:tripartite-type tricarboxylate transporter receptor subunit TctC